ncbi:unnamed protein product [Peniophora sp. CBMAI 1063]|nr:unnamed protein product [Peniophora sp. CBMAI 1063]
MGDAETLMGLSLEYKRRANTLLPIARLPREILSNIFSLVAKLDPPHLRVHPYETDWSDLLPAGTDDILLEVQGKLHPHEPTLGWIVLSHVSSAWRSLCLASPTLWSKNVGLLPKAVATFLARSGEDVPLDICVRRPRDDATGIHVIHSCIFDVVPDLRIQTIDCDSCMGRDVQKISDAICARHLPMLKKLKLEFASTMDFSLPGPLPMLNAPSLDKLVMSGVNLPFTAPNLTSISLGFMDRIDGFSGVELLHILASCPRLRSAEFLDLRLNDPDRIASTSLQATLPHLENLTLSILNPGEVYVNLLEHMILPPAVILGLWPQEPQTDEDAALLACVMRLIWRHTPCPALELDGSTSSLYFYSDINGYDDGEPQAFIVRCGFPNFLPRLIPNLQLQTYLESVTLLYVSASVRTLDRAPYRRMYELLPNVTHLRVIAGYRDARTEDNAPTSLVLHVLWNQRGPIPLPRLKEVVLAEDINVKYVNLQKDILPSLIRRTEHGAKVLKRLDLQCFEYPGEFEPITLALGRFVGEVRWKGQTAAEGS